MIYYARPISGEIPTQVSTNVGVNIFSNSQGCISSFGGDIGIGAGSVLSSNKIATLNADYLALNILRLQRKYSLDSISLIGDSPNLHTLVASLNNSNKQIVKSTLVQFSPFLSESILREVGQKASNLIPLGWYRDLVLANLELARSNDFMLFLSTKSNALPLGHIKQIESMRFTSNTERTRRIDEILDINDKLTNIAELLIQNVFADSNYLDWNSYNNLVESRGDVLCKTQHSDMYLGTKKSFECNQKLDALEIELGNMATGNLKRELEDFILFKRYLMAITNNTGIIESLSSIQVDELEYIRDNYIGKSAQQASNILCFHKSICREITPILNNRIALVTNVESIQMENEYIGIKNDLNVKIIPNPNIGSFELIVNDECEISLVEITDINGRNIEYERTINGELNANFSLKNVSTGIYLINITCGNGSVLNSRILIK